MQKYPSDEIKGTKNVLFFLSCAPTHHSFTFNLRFFYELRHKVRLCKTVCGFFRFRFRFVVIKVYIFVQQNTWTLWLWNVIISFKFKAIEKPHTQFCSHNSIFKLQQEVLKFNGICVNGSSPKTDLVTMFLNPENRSFENVSKVTFIIGFLLIFFKYLLFLYSITYIFL